MPRFSGSQVAYDFYNDVMARFTRRLPTRCLLLITGNCNARCRMCSIWQNKTEDLPLEFFRNLLLDRCMRNVRHLRISGGEPTLRDDVYEIGRYAIDSLKNLYRMGIATNGLLPDVLEETVRSWCEYGLRHAGPIIQAQISIDGGAETHDRIRGRGSFAKAVDCLERMDRLKATGKYPNLDYHCMTVIQPSNVDHIEETDEMIKSSGWDTVYSIATVGEAYYNNEKLLIRLTEEQEAKAVDFLLNKAADTKNPVLKFYYRDLAAMARGAERRRGCPMMRETIVIDHRGHVIPCLMVAERSGGKVSAENTVCDIWRAEAWRESISETKCPTCTQSCGLSMVDCLRGMAKFW